ncbi:hypothetical protein ACC691_40360, partial [Rhizobium johnstonii]
MPKRCGSPRRVRCRRRAGGTKANGRNEETTADAASRRSCRLHNIAVPARPLEPALYRVATPIGNLGDRT